MKKLYLGLCLLLTGTVLSACMPKEKTAIGNLSPDFNENKDVELDFTTLHNDTLELFNESNNIYCFVRDVDISGDSATKTITVTARVLDNADIEDVKAFESALVRRINDAASEETGIYALSSEEDFGTLYKDYAITVDIYDFSDLPVDSIDVPADSDFDLNPAIEEFESRENATRIFNKYMTEAPADLDADDETIEGIDSVDANKEDATE